MTDYKMKPIRIVPRRNRADGTAELFMVEDRELTCYARVGQHSTASRDYFLDCTEPVDPADEDVAALIREWDSLGPKVEFIVGKRLSWR